MPVLACVHWLTVTFSGELKKMDCLSIKALYDLAPTFQRFNQNYIFSIYTFYNVFKAPLINMWVFFLSLSLFPDSRIMSLSIRKGRGAGGWLFVLQVVCFKNKVRKP